MPAEPLKTAPKTKKARNRDPADPLFRLRSWVWLGGVWTKTDATLRGLDREFLGEENESLRAFWRIRRDGSDPGRLRYSLGNKSLVNLVASKPGYYDTKLLYRSPIWHEVLGATEMTIARRDRLISILMRRLKLFQAEKSDQFISETLQLSVTELRPCTRKVFRKQLRKLVGICKIDNILLLSLLYRRAMSAGSLEEAICVRDSLFLAIRAYCNRPGFDGRTQSLFLYIVERRVICGIRDLAPDPKSLVNARALVARRRENVQNEADQRRVDGLEFELAIQHHTHEKPQFFGLFDVNNDISQFLRNRSELLEKNNRRKIAQVLLDARNYYRKRKNN
ncbi:MAG: hypothetical protein ACREO1_14815 [Arenimonas sp.]